MNVRDRSWDEKRVVIQEAVRKILWAIGEDVEREGLKGTPERVARFWQEFATYDAGSMAAFEMQSDDLVAVKGMELWSMCEHHLLPFSIEVSVGYLPRGKVLGLSKFARIARHFATKLQIQERLVRQIADAVHDETDSPDVAVVGRGVHLCMAMRGIKTPATMHTSVMDGQFRYVGPLRAEFLALVSEKA